MESFNKFISQFPNYRPTVFEDILPYLTMKEIKAGEYFLREGKICRQIAFVEEGLFRLFYLNNGKEITECFCKEHSLVTSYTSLISASESEFAIQAIEDSKLIVLPYESLQKLYVKDLFWQQLGRIAGENEYIISECHNRFIRDLSATDRYLQILENENDLIQRVPLNYLATYIQVAPETLSRIRKKIGRT